MTPARVAFLVVGTPRSGTTLVQRLACELPGVAVPYETHFFTKGLELFEARGGFPLASDALRAALEEYAALPHLDGSGLTAGAVYERLGGEASGALAVFDAVVATLTGPAEVLGEKTPGHLHWAARLAEARPELRFVAVVREPRAVVASQRGVPWGAGPVDVAARRWVDDQRTLDGLRAPLGDRLLVLRYEDVVEDPDSARTALGSLLGRDRTAVGAGAPTTGGAPPPGLRLPWEEWKASAEAPITTARRAAWEDVLTRAEADRVLALCEPELARYGYGGAPGGLRRTWVLATAGRGSRRRAQNLARRRAARRARIATAALT